MVDRAEATPDALMLLDADDREVTFAQYREWAERTAAGLHEWGVRPGDTVAWQMPTWIETVVLLGALCRLGVRQVPGAPDLRRARADVHPRPVRRVGVHRARDVARHRLRGHRPAHRGDARHLPHPRVRPRAPERRPVGASRAGRRARRDPVGVLHVGHHGEPEGCAPHRPCRDRDRHPDGDPAGLRRHRPLRHRVPVHPHRRAHEPVRVPLHRAHARAARVVRARRRPSTCSRASASPPSVAVPRSTARSSTSNVRAGAGRSCPRCASSPAAARPCRPSCTAKCATRSAGWAARTGSA